MAEGDIGPDACARTLIEPLDVQHVDGLFAALSDGRVYAFLDEGPPASRQWLRERIERLKAGGPLDRRERWLNWAVIHDGSVVGYVQATVDAEATAQIAYVLSTQAWGRSVAYRACRMMLRILWADHGVIRIVADTETGNVRSQRLLQRLGFRRTGRKGNDLLYALDAPGPETATAG